jgi:hypothetical protein
MTRIEILERLQKGKAGMFGGAPGQLQETAVEADLIGLIAREVA